jgi:hypothetical protein
MGKYPAQVAQTLQSTNALATTFLTVVKPELRSQWEHFASSNNTNIWKVVNETKDFASTFDHFHGTLPNENNWSFIDKIHDDYEMNGIDPSSKQPYYIPEFQTFPLASNVYAPANYGTLRLLKDNYFASFTNLLMFIITKFIRLV